MFVLSSYQMVRKQNIQEILLTDDVTIAYGASPMLEYLPQNKSNLLTKG